MSSNRLLVGLMLAAAPSLVLGCGSTVDDSLFGEGGGGTVTSTGSGRSTSSGTSATSGVSGAQGTSSATGQGGGGGDPGPGPVTSSGGFGGDPGPVVGPGPGPGPGPATGGGGFGGDPGPVVGPGPGPSVTSSGGSGGASPGVCDSGFDAGDLNDCLGESCCDEFNGCTQNGSDVGSCVECIESGGGNLCDAALFCAEQSCINGGGICDSGLTTGDDSLDQCLGESCCQEFNDCVGDDPQACLDCINGNGGDLCDEALVCSEEECGFVP